MKKFLFISLISIVFLSQGFAQNEKLTYKDKKKMKIEQKYDSIRSFHPISTVIATGIWFPAGKLSEFYKPCFQMGFGLSVMTTSRSRFELGLYPRFMKSKDNLTIRHNDSVINVGRTLGGSIGAWFIYEIFDNRYILTEMFSGLSWEPLDFYIPNPIEDDTKISISTYGVSLGINFWTSIFSKQNLGFKLMYHYAAYDRSDILISETGGHSFSVSSVYRFPGRDVNWRKYY